MLINVSIRAISHVLFSISLTSREKSLRSQTKKYESIHLLIYFILHLYDLFVAKMVQAK